MRICLNEHGWLSIERSGKMKEMYCPYAAAEENSIDPSRCGDWCPKFKEEVVVTSFQVTVGHRLNCCGTPWHCSDKDFTDEREVGK